MGTRERRSKEILARFFQLENKCEFRMRRGCEVADKTELREKTIGCCRGQTIGLESGTIGDAYILLYLLKRVNLKTSCWKFFLKRG